MSAKTSRSPESDSRSILLVFPVETAVPLGPLRADAALVRGNNPFCRQAPWEQQHQSVIVTLECKWMWLAFSLHFFIRWSGGMCFSQAAPRLSRTWSVYMSFHKVRRIQMHHIHFGKVSLFCSMLEKYLNNKCNTDETRIFMCQPAHTPQNSVTAADGYFTRNDYFLFKTRL